MKTGAKSLKCAARQNASPAVAFTLLELLTVITIIGILAAIALPALNSMKPNIQAAAARQLLDDINRARQLAISQRTTVFMVFCPSNYWSDPIYGNLPQVEKDKAEPRMTGRQLISYTYVSLAGIGDQPGRHAPRYWSSWKTLPQGSFIPQEKFGQFNASVPVINIYTSGPNPAFSISGFRTNNTIPFPSENGYYTNSSSGQKLSVTVPYIAFNYLGQLVDAQGQLTRSNEFIPVTRGNVGFQKDPNTGDFMAKTLPSVAENPLGSFTNTYQIVNIDWVTGRARIEHQVVQ